MHLVIDAYGDSQKLADMALIYELLDECPSHIGMTKIAPPYVFKYIGSKPQDWGISGLVLIAESHISIHTFPERALVNIDVFSCKAFEPGQVMSYMKSRLSLTKVKKRILRRGLEYSEVDKVSAKLLKSTLVKV